MCAATVLSPEELRRPSLAAHMPFELTSESRGPVGIIGQERAVAAAEFGIGIRRPGYNLFVIGPPGVGKRTLLRQFLDQSAAGEPAPSDWCYVHNFAEPSRPRALELPAGRGRQLEADVARMVVELRVAMRAAFDSSEYRTRKHALLSDFKERQECAASEVQERARKLEIAVMMGENGAVVAPLRKGEPIERSELEKLPSEEQARLAETMKRVSAEVEELLHTFHVWMHEYHRAQTTLDRETAAAVARQGMAAVRERQRDLPVVLAHLGELELDVIESWREFLEHGADGIEAALRRALRHDDDDSPAFRRYRVNVLVDNTDRRGAPVVYEDNPTYPNLMGRIEHESQLGTLVTTFTLIKAGAFHRANGGYLLLDALDVLRHPYAWDAVKRTLRAGELRMESLGQALGLVPTVSLEPTPVPLRSIKLVLFGDRQLYYLLSELDPDFLELFKVLVDFEDDLERRPETEQVYAGLIATLVQKEGLRPFDRHAVARVVEQGARVAGDAERLSVHMRRVLDLLREADYWAQRRGRAKVSREDVQAAIDAQRQRADRLPRRIVEAIRREQLLIDTSGEKVGQINGLSVITLGEHSFAHPTRITARVRLGKGELIDIEREVDLGGPLHSKGVLILAGFLGGRYSVRTPLSLSATLVFEQSYGAVEGDSASLAELCALLSALAELPVRQSLAVTGSVNQHGQVQPIGAVNEKIEGFFDACQRRGLVQGQGVVIPRANVKHLMLREDMVEAVRAGQFRVVAVAEVDDVLELLLGRAAGGRDSAGRFTEGTVNGLVESRLLAFAESSRSFLGRPPAGGKAELV